MGVRRQLSKAGRTYLDQFSKYVIAKEKTVARQLQMGPELTKSLGFKLANGRSAGFGEVIPKKPLVLGQVEPIAAPEPEHEVFHPPLFGIQGFF
jgi:hypothetical protein